MVILSTLLTGASGMSLTSPAPPNRSSRLYRALVETGLAAAVSGSISPMLDPYLYNILATVRTGRSLDEVEAALDDQVAQIVRDPISSEELGTAIKQARAQFAYSSESVTSQGYWLGYSSIVADSDWFETFLDRLASVSVDDVYRAANTYLLRRNRTVGRYLAQGLQEETR
jgi:zinc protease